MSSGPLVKAVIRTIEPPKIEVTCLFNPNEYQLQRSNNWGQADNSTKDGSDMTFSGSSGAKLSMQLFFDTYLTERTSNSEMAKDVREYTDQLWQMMNISDTLRDPKTQKGRPPKVIFSWGKNWLFNAVITSMEQKYTMFTPSGMPVRAMVTIEFQEAVEHRSLIAVGAAGMQSAVLRTTNPEIDQRAAMASSSVFKY